MFKESKFVVCIKFTKYKVHCALAHIQKSKVDVLGIDEMKIEAGVIEEGIVYDVEYLKQIVKNLITSVAKTVDKIDAAWIIIPDNKIKIANIQVPKTKNGEIDEYEFHRALEEKFQYPPSKMYIYYKHIHDINQYAFLLVYGIKPEHIYPYKESVSVLNLNVESIFPTFECIYCELKKYFSVPSLLLYKYFKSYKFFIADDSGVYADSIWGHNIIDLDENFDKAILEVVDFARQSKEIALDVKKILLISSDDKDSELLQMYLRKTNLDFNWISSDTSIKDIDKVWITALKGLLKSSLQTRHNRGLLSDNPIKSEDLPYQRDLLLKNSLNKDANKNLFKNKYESNISQNIIRNQNKNLKSTLISILLSILLIGLLLYAGWIVAQKTLGNNITTKKQNLNISPNSTSTPTNSKTPTSTSITTTTSPIITPTNTPEPTPSPFTKSDVKVLVLNANNKGGEARFITNLLQTNGFITKSPGNYTQGTLPTTSVKYKDRRSKEVSENIVKLIENRYPSAKAEYDPNIDEDILVLLGTT